VVCFARILEKSLIYLFLLSCGSVVQRRYKQRATPEGRQAAQYIGSQCFGTFTSFKETFRRSFISDDQFKKCVNVVRVFGVDISKDVSKSVVARQRCNAGAFALAHASHTTKFQFGGRAGAQLRNYNLSEAGSTAGTIHNLSAITA
jgi:hypothetical protein